MYMYLGGFSTLQEENSKTSRPFPVQTLPTGDSNHSTALIKTLPTGDSSHSNALIRELLCALLLSSLQRSLLDSIICRLVRPEFEVLRAVSRLTDLPRHPWHAQTIEYSDMICEYLRLVLATCAKFFEKRQLAGGLSMFQGDWAFGPEFFNATVGVKGHEIKRLASPVFWDVGVRELVASAYWQCQSWPYATDCSVWTLGSLVGTLTSRY